MRRAAILLLAVATLAACGDDDEAATTTTTLAPATTTSTTGGDDDATNTTTETPRSLLPVGELETVIGGLSVPWEIAFVDETTFLVTERGGVIRVVEDGALRQEPVATLDAVARGEGGVLGMALHPLFPDVRAAYVHYTAADGNQVSRFEVAGDLTFSDEEVIIGGIPAAPVHDGGRIAFGPDTHLYVTTGDAADPDSAADLDSLAGKILRIADDGSIPDDNPFEGSPVWSYGHRNPQGLAWGANGAMYASEHGPSGEFGMRANDEVNRIEAGGFYGWPFVIGGQPTGSGEPPADPIEPLAASGDADTWAPSGIAVLPGPDGDVLLVAGLRGAALLRFDVTDDGVEARDAEVDGIGRIRIVTIGPDDCLYLGTSNTDGRGDPGPDDDRILRSC